MLDGLAEVLLRRGLAASVPPTAVFDQRGVDDAEDAMRFAIGRFDLDCLIGGRDGFLQAVLAHEEPGQLGRDVGRLRVELCRTLERADRAVDVVSGFEMPAQQEL